MRQKITEARRHGCMCGLCIDVRCDPVGFRALSVEELAAIDAWQARLDATPAAARIDVLLDGIVSTFSHLRGVASKALLAKEIRTTPAPILARLAAMLGDPDHALAHLAAGRLLGFLLHARRADKPAVAALMLIAWRHPSLEVVRQATYELGKLGKQLTPEHIVVWSSLIDRCTGDARLLSSLADLIPTIEEHPVLTTAVPRLLRSESDLVRRTVAFRIENMFAIRTVVRWSPTVQALFDAVVTTAREAPCPELEPFLRKHIGRLPPDVASKLAPP